MTTINQLPRLSSISGGDQLVVWSPSNGDSRRVSASELASYVDSAIQRDAGDAANLVDDYGAMPGWDCSAALQAFFDDPDAQVLRIPYSALSYNFGIAVVDTSSIDKHVICDSGVILRRTATITVVKSIAQLDWIANITGVSVVTSEIGEQPSTPSPVTTEHNELTIDGPARLVSRGSIMKIVSDDVLLNAKDNAGDNKRRKGEHAVTAAAVGQQSTTANTIILTAILLDTYPTVPRVAKVNEKRFSWDGGKFIDNVPIINTSEFGMIDCVGLVRPQVVNVEFENVYGSCIRTTGSFAPLIWNIKGGNIHNQAMSDVFGYLVNDVSTTGAVMSKLYGADIRHVVTTNTSVSPVASGEGVNTTEMVHRHGRTRQGMVSDSYGAGCSNGAFDTHAETDGYTFINCIAEGSFAGPQSGGVGFGVRGYNVTMIGCRAVNCRVGFVLLGIDNTNLIDCEARRARNTGLNITGSENPAAGNRRITIRGGYYESYDIPALIGVAGAVVDVFLDGATFAITGTEPGSGFKRIISLTAVTVRGRNVRLDYTQYVPSGAATVQGIEITSGVCNVSIDGVSFVMPSPSPSNLTLGSLIRATSPGNTSTVRITGVQYAGPIDFTSANQNGNIFTLANLSGNACASGEKVVAGVASQSGYLVAAPIVSGGFLQVNLCADRLMLARIEAGSAITTGTLSLVNRRDGDILKLVNTGAHAITIGPVTVAATSSATIAVVDGAWRQAN
jgi:hypothetical protein